MKYWAINADCSSDAVFLSRLSSEMPESYKFDEGISLVDEYPSVEDCKIYYDPQYPEGTQLYDFLDSINALLIVNSKVKKIFDEIGITSIEYLPIWLCDHKHEISSKDYVICNVIQSVDIIDMDSSSCRMSFLDESQVDRIKNLVVDYKAIPDDAKVFRASKKLDQIFISDDVKEALEKAGIEGYVVKKADGWNGL
ncbi:imm11 family protein [Teredinibacter sp. KSP-S5-2]|uniref:imm11 family protein n=1 Tax=Teredinibacter sp. KSP-S5-2 TaxID=3034506 RepID=UPI002934917E|nr:DUF1629 domain-containing protein [Teredinibacter sp. KSP-S5-2]WNO08427.1 hypothetical protein P5V12_15765 [Teredinibacter sp. KSP-S5-2]